MPDARPNIILIMTDQQRFDTIRALGAGHMQTPHLDRLVREGVSFDYTYVSAPSCAPSRASLFMGQSPHNHGVFKNADVWRQRTWVEDLAAAGYHCVNVGKMHTFPYEDPFGFHERYVVENKDRYLEGRYYFDEWDKALHARGLEKPGRLRYRHLPDYRERMGAVDWPIDEDMHPDVFVGQLAKWWTLRYPVTEPLFLQVGFPGPHPPYDPVARYTAAYRNQPLPIQGQTAADLAGQPPPLHALREHNVEIDHDSVVHDLNPTAEQLQRLRSHYLANVTMIDEQIGELMAALKQQGYLDNAVVIFTSDHGDALGDHGHIQKWTMYESIVRVPLIVWSPERFDGGRRLDALVQQMDLGATILELAGLPVPATMEAQSLLPALQGEPFAGRDAVFSEHGRDAILQATAFMTMIRTRTHKLVHFLDEPYGQLFDLTADPGEVQNLWDDPSAAQIKQELLDQLREWMIRSSYQSKNQPLTWG
ncbi:MAG TPA: sulfatase-like hydrolase/transferase [Limnochordia bacterium]|nr:sulfatase-like hydrolase/transferase [Limnochordia bacterium]